MIPPEPSLSSLRGMVQNQYQLTAYCSNAFHCRHSAVLRLEMLVQRLGWDFNIVERRAELRHRLVCTHCATRIPDLIVMPYTPEPAAGTGGAHNAMDVFSVDEVIARERAFRAAVARREPEFDEPLPPKGSYRRRFG
jgi:hypothetical protein